MNLLFITSSKKIDGIVTSLQPLLKVKIDVVADFDFGLKDVFEKRPATVFIQDQIAGVTGESVARHIQMLLGAGAPSFIFMHEGSTKAKPIKGLFECLIDLSQADPKVLHEIIESLKLNLGSQWDKIYHPPKVEQQPASDTSALFPNLIETQSQHNDSAPQVTAAVNSVGPSSVDTVCAISIEKSVTSAFDSFEVVSSPHDQLAEMIATAEQKTTPTPEDDTIERTISESGSFGDSSDKTVSQRAASDLLKMRTEPEHSKVDKADRHTADLVVPPSVSAATRTTPRVEPQTIAGVEAPVVNESPADFVIVGERSPAHVAPEELLRVFEGTIQPRSHVVKRMVIISILLLISGVAFYWYVGKNVPFKVPNSKSDVKPVVTTPVPQHPSVEEGKQVQHHDQYPAVEKIPSFIPKAGYDKSYSSLKPGWERYVDVTADYRIFRTDGKIKAVQVLGAQQKSISEDVMKSVIKELAGTGEYRVNQRKDVDGLNVSQAVVGSSNHDLLIYKQNNHIRAFVISIN